MSVGVGSGGLCGARPGEFVDCGGCSERVASRRAHGRARFAARVSNTHQEVSMANCGTLRGGGRFS